MYPVSTKHLWQHQTIRGNQANADDDRIGVYEKDGKTNTLKNSCSKHQQALFFAPTAYFDKIIRKRMSR